MSVVLPQSVDYSKQHPALPDSTNLINVAAAPSNGNTFTANNQIFIDLIQRGFLIPESVYLSYTITWAGATAGTTFAIQCPAYQTIARLDTQVGSTTVETIQSYNNVMAMLTNCQLSTAEKYGLQSCFAYGGDISGVSLENLDGRLFGSTTETYNVAVPLPCLLTNAEKLVPLGLMPQVRLILTLDAIANICGSASQPTGYTVSNVQLRYKVLDFGGSVEDMVAKMNPDGKFYIKSQSFGASSMTLPASSGGYQELVFNSRYASVKSLFAVNGSTSANKQFESFDLTQGNGDYSFNIAGVMYPSIPLSSKTNRSALLMELKSAIGSIYARNNSFSINAFEFSRNEGTATTFNAPAKFYVGTSVEKLDSQSHAILSGVSTQSSPISYRINMGGVSTGANSLVTLIVNYDALIEVDAINRQCAVKL